MILSLLGAFGIVGLSAKPASAGDGSSHMSLPWATGESWTLLSSQNGRGLHSWSGYNSPTSSLDFTTTNGSVRAVAPGTVHRDAASCPSEGYVRIDHGGGWQTTYYHLKDMPTSLTEGSQVARGDFLGHVGNNIPCGGSAPDVAHVHFTLWYFTSGSFSFSTTQEANLIGVDIGGWTVGWDGTQNKTYLKRISDNTTKYINATIFNDGSIGSGANETPRVGDFNGDGKDDVVSFTQSLPGTGPDVWVNLSNGTDDFTSAGKWHDDFAPRGERPMVGDFDGDGYDDIATFTQWDTGADVWVALNDYPTYNRFAPTGTLWHTDFARRGETPAVGDFNGDGKDDIAVFTQGSTADVWVALNNYPNSSQFVTTGSPWHTNFAPAGETPAVGDFDGDGDDDIATFTQGSTADVWVALSNRTSAFVTTGSPWHTNFAPAGETPAVGDVDGDGDDDIVTFTQTPSGTSPDVWVALSNRTSLFVNPTNPKWHDNFAPRDEKPMVGNFDGDTGHKADIVAFSQGTGADVWVATSNGSSLFVNPTDPLWQGYFAPGYSVNW